MSYIIKRKEEREEGRRSKDSHKRVGWKIRKMGDMEAAKCLRNVTVWRLGQMSEVTLSCLGVPCKRKTAGIWWWFCPLPVNRACQPYNFKIVDSIN